MSTLTFDEAKKKLETCIRSELRDHSFGDAEVVWVTQDTNETLAEGYNGKSSEVTFYLDDDVNVNFEGQEAKELMKLGIEGVIARNDSTGPDEFKVGEVMPGLTLEGVREELTEPCK